METDNKRGRPNKRRRLRLKTPGEPERWRKRGTVKWRDQGSGRQDRSRLTESRDTVRGPPTCCRPGLLKKR